MSSAQSSVVFFPRYTTLVGQAVAPDAFCTVPLDVSQFGGVQIQTWFYQFAANDAKLYIEESLDGVEWPNDARTEYDVNGGAGTAVEMFFSVGFRLRWFRLCVELGSVDSTMLCWAEGILRGGGGGATRWNSGGGMGANPNAAARVGETIAYDMSGRGTVPQRTAAGIRTAASRFGSAASKLSKGAFARRGSFQPLPGGAGAIPHGYGQQGGGGAVGPGGGLGAGAAGGENIQAGAGGGGGRGKNDFQLPPELQRLANIESQRDLDKILAMQAQNP